MFNTYMCGGSLINDGVISIAAHCVYKACEYQVYGRVKFSFISVLSTLTDLIVRCGDTDVSTIDGPLPFKSYLILSFFLYLLYSKEE